MRYRLLEVIRQYGWGRLHEAGEATLVRRRHAEWCLALAEQAEPELTGASQAAWLARLEREHDNLRMALHWAIDAQQGELALRLCAALWWFWRVHGHLSEGRRWLGAALACNGSAAPILRARLLGAAEALRETIGMPLLPGDRPDYDRTAAATRAGLGGRFAAWAAGRALPLEEAVAQPLAADNRGPAPSALSGEEGSGEGAGQRRRQDGNGYLPRLTAREREIASFVAQGISNRRIAEMLAIGERTVDTHLRVLRKLGLVSRTEIGAWLAHQQGPTARAS